MIKLINKLSQEQILSAADRLLTTCQGLWQDVRCKDSTVESSISVDDISAVVTCTVCAVPNVKWSINNAEPILSSTKNTASTLEDLLKIQGFVTRDPDGFTMNYWRDQEHMQVIHYPRRIKDELVIEVGIIIDPRNLD